MKLKTISKQVTELARQYIGGFGMYVELGERYSTLEADNQRETRSVNLESFADIEDTDLWETLSGSSWRDKVIPENAELDFYVYDRDELRDNLGILVRGGKIVAFNIVGWKRKGAENPYDAWRPIEGGDLQPKSFFPKQ